MNHALQLLFLPLSLKLQSHTSFWSFSILSFYSCQMQFSVWGWYSALHGISNPTVDLIPMIQPFILFSLLSWVPTRATILSSSMLIIEWVFLISNLFPLSCFGQVLVQLRLPSKLLCGWVWLWTFDPPASYLEVFILQVYATLPDWYPDLDKHLCIICKAILLL